MGEFLKYIGFPQLLKKNYFFFFFFFFFFCFSFGFPPGTPNRFIILICAISQVAPINLSAISFAFLTGSLSFVTNLSTICTLAFFNPSLKSAPRPITCQGSQFSTANCGPYSPCFLYE